MEVVIRDGGVDKTFVIAKMKATQLDSFINLAVRAILKDGVKFPNNILSGDLRQTIFNIVQNGQQEDDAKPLSQGKLLENILPILRSAYANLAEDDRVLLLDKLISTCTYKNGILNMPLNYNSIDSHIENVSTIYKLAWEVILVNFTLLSAGKS